LGTPVEQEITGCFLLHKEFGWTHKEVLELPASTFQVLLEELGKYYEQQNKALRKSGGGPPKVFR